MAMKCLRGLHVIRGGTRAPSLGSRATTPDTTEPADTMPEAPGDAPLGILEVNFSQFNTWYEIDSFWEGRFLERTMSGSFKRTIAQQGSSVKVLFNHGMDMMCGDMPICVPDLIEERAESPYLEGALLQGTPDLLVSGLRAGAYGSSFMFEVLSDSWEYEPAISDYNPNAIPERTITEVRLYEAGPVTWPANPDSTASLRSGVDWYADQIKQRDQRSYDEMVRSFTAFRALNRLPGPATSAPDDRSPARHVDGVTAAARRRRLTLIDLVR